MHFLHVVGARPNFMKVAPVMRALGARQGVRQTLVHTGQHYDQNMSDVFFRELEIPEPDFNLAVGREPMPSRPARLCCALNRSWSSRNPIGYWFTATLIRRSLLRWYAQNCKFPLPMWKPACARSTAACRRRSTGC